MPLPDRLTERRTAILDAWLDRVLSVYAEQAAGRMRREKDPFQNPVGSNLRRGLETILDGLLAGAPAESVDAGIDAIVRIRAVQDLAASEAVGPLVELKAILREHTDDAAGLAELDGAIDRVMLRAFDQYVACREKLYEIRINEIRNQSHLALRQFGILGREPDPGLPFTAGGDAERGSTE